MTALALHALAAREKLGAWSLGRAAQFAGRISYSLYLTHAITIEALVRATRAVGGEVNGALWGFFLAIPLSILVAQGFYKCVEQPSMKLAARFKAPGAAP